ncbi:P1 family peptidase [Bilophila wadsworthia]|uniref:P1 family peptidase n=1 Tax=Bilophila wadsworthia TaxID=35833 RepID=UPI00307B1F6B
MNGLDFPRVGVLPSGQLDAITDVGDIRVGHCTLDEGNVHTGVTVVLPNDDPLMQKPLAASCIFNGFGKSVGLMQMAELGCLETPLALTNTFSVGAIATAQIRAAAAAHPEVGREWSTVNPLVLECNDGYLNDIQSLAVTEKHYIEACASASREFRQGSVGAGRGMSCFHLKGGIGSASRIAECGGRPLR